MTSNYVFVVLAALTLFPLAAQPAIASPIRLSHQGRILDASGEPLDGEHQVEVRFANEDGDTLWSDTFTTTFRGGYYHLVLGDAAPLEGALFQGGRPILWLSVDAGAPMEVDGPLADVPYAAVTDWARTAQDVRGGVVDATEIRLDGRTVLQAGATTHLARVRAEDGLQLGAASAAACEATTRGLLRYPPGGPLEVCSTSGWTEVGGAGGPSTCSVVGECPNGEPGTRVSFSTIHLRSPREVELFCSAYDENLASLAVSVDPDVNLPCLQRAWVFSAAAGPEAGPWLGIISLPALNAIRDDAGFTGGSVIAPTLTQIGGRLLWRGASPTSQVDMLSMVGRALALEGTQVGASLPALRTVGADLSFTLDPSATGTSPLTELFPALEHIGGKLTGPDAGPPVPMPNLLHVGGDYTAPTVSAPALREVGGTVTLIGPQPELPALETVGGLILGQPGANYSWEMTAAPFPLDSLASLRRIDGNLSIRCVIGWNQPEIDAFIDRIGRANIAGTITTRTYDHCRMTN